MRNIDEYNEKMLIKISLCGKIDFKSDYITKQSTPLLELQREIIYSEIEI